ncbi:hypothetical protein Zmor_024131 [Zophobas morio]|uniref:Uncharacterized protein n=1 Tax=Zophobas morio TaxID=2755281 RepID=A0AA38I0A8_9CUCU|nr:hypothetical protein Zmor_024131 [Zophobas morio]
MAPVCKFCNDIVTDKDTAQCGLCKDAFHGGCAGLSGAELKCLKKEDRKISFQCNASSSLKANLLKINDLTATISSLKEEVNNLKKVVTDILKKATSDNADIVNDAGHRCDCNEIINEIMDRQRRESNLIFFKYWNPAMMI